MLGDAGRNNTSGARRWASTDSQSQAVSSRYCVAAVPSVPGEGKPDDATVLHETSSRTAVFRPAAGEFYEQQGAPVLAKVCI